MKKLDFKSTDIKEFLFKTPLRISSFITVIFCSVLFLFNFCNLCAYNKIQTPAELSPDQIEFLNASIEQNWPDKNQLLHSLPYNTSKPLFDIYAKSAILVDVSTGDILFEKNADEEIPPASMTKLVEMYVVFKEIQSGRISLDDVVPLFPECWAVNLPYDASKMFIQEGHKVTLRELLLGLAIASGNDASIAVAHYVAGSMEEFVNRMNKVISDLGLKKTHFVESSGYSELNITTAREFAAFARVYLTDFPWSLEMFHAQKVLKYPLQHNLPNWQSDEPDKQTIVQYNTNKLLGKLEGCDGLKTGFINESGYNLSLTCLRDGTRLLSVTMGGPGRGSAEGNIYRSADGTTLMDYGFNSFAPYTTQENSSYNMRTIGSKNRSVKLIAAAQESFSVPFIAGDSPKASAKSVTKNVILPKSAKGKIICGKQYGTIQYKIGETVLNNVPLIADRNSEECWFGKRIADKIAELIF